MLSFWVKNRISGKNSAFGLIEVLIASVVLAVGLLGVAVLQQKAMLLARSSENSSIASMLATEMSNRMTCNATATSTYLTNPISAVATQATKCYSTTTCSTIEMAQTDLYDWYQQIISSLPGGNGRICAGYFTAPPATLTCTGIIAATGIYTIEVSWTDVVTGSTKIFTMQTSYNP